MVPVVQQSNASAAKTVFMVGDWPFAASSGVVWDMLLVDNRRREEMD